MPSAPPRTPESYTPTDADLLDLVRQRARPGCPLSLKELCGLLWQDLPWDTPLGRGDSASRKHRQGGLTAAQHIKARMQVLCSEGKVRLARRIDEVDSLAATAYEVAPCLPSGRDEP